MKKIWSNKNKDRNYELLYKKRNVKPYKEALFLAFIYVLSGVLYILVSDKITNAIFDDIQLIKKIQLFKGWVYVFVTGFLIYYLIVKRMKEYKNLLNSAYYNYEKLTEVYKDLIKIEEEMRENYKELEKHRNALAISEERYRLAVEGASEGIWDLDLISNVYLFSIKWKSTLGYSTKELDNTFETWVELLHSEDKDTAVEKIQKYITSGHGVYESTYRLRCKDGSYRWILSRGQAIRDNKGKAVRVAGSHTDITERKLMEEKLYFFAYHDSLTGLPNKLTLINEFDRLKRSHDKMVILYLDIDNFKHINDTLGHESGDKLIKYISKIFKRYIKFPNLVVRLGGDEFALLLTDINSVADIKDKINFILKLIRRPWILQKHEFFVSVSIGVALYPDNGSTLNELLKCADSAMFCAKENGKDRYCIYTKSIEEKNLYHIKMLSQLRNAIEKKEFRLFFQPIVDLRTGEIKGVEALIRWIHPLRGFIAPSEFIPIAEATGQIVPISKWVFKTACQQKKDWESKGFKPIEMSINLSEKRLIHNELISDIKEIFRNEKDSLYNVQFEITETSVMSDLDHAIKVLNNLRALGIKIALDDFGTGYSSLTYLKKLPIDVLKMDKNFIQSITDKSEDKFIIKSVIELAHNIDLQVVAEGIETQKQLSFLIDQKCDMGQGYFFCKPLPPDRIEEILPRL